MSRYDNRSRRLARERYWEKHDKGSYDCPDCGRSGDEIIGEFQVHHKNGNPHDNRLSELVALCGCCHRLREGEKPSLRRIRALRDTASSSGGPQVHPFIESFIDERLCLCSEGRDYPWFDVFSVHFGALDSHLDEWGYEINNKFRFELLRAYGLLPETEFDWSNPVPAVIGPDPHGLRSCDCLTSDELAAGNDGFGDWR